MQPIPWKEQFSVGVKEIDLQHRGLLDIINRVVASSEKKDDWQSTSAIIDSLITYAYNHFATEERLMSAAGYPELSWHTGLHLEFIRKIFSMSQEVQQKGPAIQKEILSFLVNWYTHHVLEVDRKYMASLAAKGIK